MPIICEEVKNTPVFAETEVLIVGGGPAGLSAALASAREGVDTILVERYGFLGGNITQAMVDSLVWYRQEKTVEAGGIGTEIEEFAKAFGGTYPDPQSIGCLLDADMFKCAADKLVEQSGVRVLLHCYVVSAIVDEGSIKGVITESKSGRQAILSKIVIDASGDADVAAFAGVPFTKAPENELMPVTTGFGLSGVDIETFRRHVAAHPGKLGDWAVETVRGEENFFSPCFNNIFERARKEGVVPDDVNLNGYWSTLTEAGEATGLNVIKINNIDCTNMLDLTRAEIEGRRQIFWAIEVLRRYQPGFEKAKLRTIGSSIGTRESRKIEGHYCLTGHDVKNQAHFEDSIGIFPEFLDAYGIVILPTTGRYFHVPYRVMVPKHIDNLLVAGRSVCSDKIAFAATRQMMCCAVTGQGAGIAAATAVNNQQSTSNVNIKEIQRQLKKQNVRIE